MSNSFNFDEALKDLQSGKDLTGKDGILMPLIKQLKTKFYNKPERRC
jgi:putative transposase